MTMEGSGEAARALEAVLAHWGQSYGPISDVTVKQIAIRFRDARLFFVLW